MKMALTDVVVRTVSPPAAGRIEISDLRSQGLVLRVTSAGARTWCFRFRDPQTGRSVRSTIATYPDLSLSNAREQADELRKVVAQGANPVTLRRRERAEADTKTFAALAHRYLIEHARRFKKSAHLDERNLRLHLLPAWGKRRFDQISRTDVIAMSEGLIANGKPVLANRVQALVSTIFSFAIDADMIAANPASRLRKRAKETPVTRTLTDDEIRLFWPHIMQPPVSGAVGLAMRLALLTAMRAGEVAGLARTEIMDFDDPQRAAILIPSERSKNGRPHLVPLSPMARQVVADAMVMAGDQPWVFPSPKGGPVDPHAFAVAMRRFAEGGPDDSPGALTWKAAPPTPHDLRRTCATRLAESGVPGEDVAAILNHVRQDITGKHYDQYARAREKRAALNLWSGTLGQILNCDQVAAAVPPMRRPA
jgi:integrase